MSTEERQTAFEILWHPGKGVIGLREVGSDDGFFMPPEAAEALAQDLLKAVEEVRRSTGPERGRLIYFGKDPRP